MSRIKAIETEFAGHRFRSRLEARWAVFFNAIGIEWQYEHEGYELSDGTRYLPDFYLPAKDQWVEVKGVLSRADLLKAAAAAVELPTRETSQVHPGVLLLGALPYPGTPVAHKRMAALGGSVLWQGVFFNSDGEIKPIGDPVVYPVNMFSWLPAAEVTRLCDDALTATHEPDLRLSDRVNDAYGAGRSARFEHGESGATATAKPVPSRPEPPQKASPETKPSTPFSTPLPKPASSQLPRPVLEVGDVRRAWDEVIAAVRRTKPRVSALLMQAGVKALDGDTLVLALPHAVHAEMLAKSPNVLIEALAEVLGVQWQLRMTTEHRKAGSPTSPVPPQPASAALDIADVRRAWDEVIAAVRRKKPRVAMLATEATVKELRGDTLVLTFRHTVHAEMLAKSPEALIEALAKVLGVQWQLRMTTEP